MENLTIHKMIWKIFVCFCIFLKIAGLEILHSSIAQETGSTSDQKSFTFRLNTMCGPNCLWQIAKAYGKDYALKDIAKYAGTNANRGTTVKGLVEACRKIGLPAKAVKTNVEMLARDPRVAIMLLLDVNNLMHYVILDRISDNEIRLLDATEFQEMTINELESLWTGVAILVGDPPNDRRFNVARILQTTGLAIALIGITYFGVFNLLNPKLKPIYKYFSQLS